MRFARHLVVFARLARLGVGKRRLAKDVGAVAALRFQRTMLAITLRRLARDPRWVTWLAVTPDRPRPGRTKCRVLSQGRGTLGQRLATVARSLPPGPVVIVGSDLPGISAAGVARAFRALGHSDAVFGPATDGGYWLAGLRRRPTAVDPFEPVRWSTEHALVDTLANLRGRPVAFVETLEDVDDGAALERHRHWELTHAVRRRQAAS